MKKQIPIVMPQMGQSVAEGTILKWAKKIGEEVRTDEILLEVETDKTTVEVESPVTGKLAVCLKQEGEIAAAGETIGRIEVEVSGEPEPRAAGDKPHALADTEPELVNPPEIRLDFNTGSPLPEINRDRFSPYVLRLAMSNGINLQELEALRGSGRQGRVTKSDLLQYLSRRPIGSPVVHATASQGDGVSEGLEALGDVVPMNSLRRTIADHMVQSIRTSAHVMMVHAVDMTHLVDLRNRIKQDFFEKTGARMTYTGVVLYVTSRVLKDFPKINASIRGTNIVMRKDVNIGCAVALADETLVVPVVQNADKKTFPEIAQDLERLIRLARQKELTRQDVENGTFTISNFGSFGSLMGTPIINQPQVAILGMGAIHKSPVVRDGQIAIRDILYLNFSFDHRIIDGDLGGRFLNTIQTYTESLTEQALSLTKL